MDKKDEVISNPNARAEPGDEKGSSPSFADLLDEYEPEPLRRGQLVEGEILQIEDHVILADVDAKRTAVIPPQDLEQVNQDVLDELSEGDEVTLYVLRTPVGDEDLLVSLQKGLEQQDWVEAKENLSKEELLELEVIGHNKGGLLVAFGHLRGFVPTSHVPQLFRMQSPKDLAGKKAKLVGKDLPLKVIEVDRKRKRLVLSAKAAQKELRRERLLELKQMIGETLVGRVTNVVDFGAFVDLDGVEGLIHVSEIAWQQVNDPGEFLSPGQDIEVQLLSMDVDRERVGLSRKALLPNPWEHFAQTHAIGDLIEGVVTNVIDFGAFVKVTDNIEGLIHVSEMRGTRLGSPQEVLREGDSVLTRITSIEPERERLGLSQRQISDTEEMEWIWQKEQSLSSAATSSDDEKKRASSAES